MKQNPFITVFFSIIVLMMSCTSSNPLDIDVSGIEAEVKIERLDQKLFQAKPGDLARLNREFLTSYGELWETYVSVMLRTGSANDSLIDISLERFINDPVMKQVYQDIQIEFADLSETEKELAEAFKHLKFYFPDAKIPRMVAYNSVFNYGVSTFENFIGLGLDMYLGPTNRTV